MPAPKDPEKYEEWVENLSKSHRGRVSPKSIQTLVNYVKTHKPQGMKGKHLSEDHKQILLKTLIGHKVSETTREKIRSKHIGLKPSEQSRRKMSLAKIGKTPWNKGIKLPYDVWNKGKKGVMPIPWNKGKHNYLSEETINRLSQTRKGRSPANKGQKMDDSFRAQCRQHRAKQIFPNKDTWIEKKLHEILDSINVKYHKHFPVYHPKMGYHQVDIMFVDYEGNPKLAIECDGCYWHGCKEHGKDNKMLQKIRKRDMLIDKSLKELGIKVIRLWEHDIKKGRIPLEIYNVGEVM